MDHWRWSRTAFGLAALAMLLAPTMASATDQARAYWNRRRCDSTGVVPVQRYVEAKDRVSRMPGGPVGGPLPAVLSKALAARSSTFAATTLPPTTGAWTNLGPGNVGGRTRALAVLSGGTIYAAGASGGVWKSTDGGASFAPLTDFMANLAVCTLAVDPSEPGRIYAGTGEGYANPGAVRGAGIFVSTDAGATWSQLPGTASPAFFYVNRIVVSPTDRSVLYAATGGASEDPADAPGIFRSPDRGTTWTRQASGSFLELAVLANGTTDNLFAWRAYDTLYRSIDGGDTFVASGAGLPAGMVRASIAVADAARAYVAVSANDGRFAGFFESIDNGGSWSRKDDPSVSEAQRRLNTLLFSQAKKGLDLDGDGRNDCDGGAVDTSGKGRYDNVIAVDPADRDRIWLGGIDLWRSDDRGVSWGLASYSWMKNDPHAAHAGHHAIAFPPGYDGYTVKSVYFGNDGGICRADDARAAVATVAYNPYAACGTSPLPGVTFTSLDNGYGVTQFNHGAVSPSGTFVIGGTQGCGTLRLDPNSARHDWREILSGDGGYCVVDPRSPNIMYYEAGGLSLAKSLDYGTTSVTVTSGITEPGPYPYVVPVVMDPSSSSRLWTGKLQPWKTIDGAASWTSASGGVTLTASPISALAVAPNASGQVVYLGTESGEVYRCPNGLSPLPAWTAIDGGLPHPFWVSSIGVHPVDPNIVWVAYSSFGVPGGQVWRTLDASGRSGPVQWEACVGSGTNQIPDLPVHGIVPNPALPDLLFVGTDLGVFGSSDAGATWANVNGTSLANVPVTHLAYAGTSTLFAFTNGRGAYRVPVGSPPITLGAPYPGTVIGPGVTSNVTWTLDAAGSLFPSMSVLRIDFSGDGGSTYPISLGSTAPTSRALSWTTAAAHHAAKARVRIQARDASGNVLAEDTTDGDFTVNGPPNVVVSEKITATPGSTAVLDASSTTDPDGDSLTFRWTQIAGRPVSVSWAAPKIRFVAPEAGSTQIFRLEVSDGIATVTRDVELAVIEGDAVRASDRQGGGGGGTGGCDRGVGATGTGRPGPIAGLPLALLVGHLLLARRSRFWTRRGRFRARQ